MAVIQAGGGGAGSAGPPGSLQNRSIVKVATADQIGGKYLLAWNTERKVKHGDIPSFDVWLADQLEIVPVVKKRDLDGNITGYEFELTNIPAEIVII